MMKSFLVKEGVSKLSIFYLFCIIIYAGNATTFARSLGNPTAFANAFAIILMIIVVVSNKIHFNKNFWISIGVFMLYALVTTINNARISPMWISNWLIFLTLSYVLCQDLREKLFITYERILYILCIISLVMWGIQVVNPKLVKTIVHIFSFSQPYGSLWGYTGADCNVLDNMIVYTLGVNYQDGFIGAISRNPGFAWEPGAFSAFICLALFCNAIRTNYRIKGNWPLLVFVASLLTTQSTTGILTFGVMIVAWLIINKKYYYAIVLMPAMIYVYSLPFVGEKIDAQWTAAEARSLNEMDMRFHMSRFQSFWLEWEEFLKHPIIGLGGWYGGAAFREYYSSYSGIGQLFSRYGILLACLFFYLLWKTTTMINRCFSTKNAVTMIIAILGMMVSYSLWEEPMYISFWLYGLFVEGKKEKMITDYIGQIRKVQ